MDKAIRERLASAGTLSELRLIATDHPDSFRSGRDLSVLARRIDDLNKPACRLAILGDFTLDDLGPAISAKSLIASGIPVATYLGPYSQQFQEVLNSGSGLHQFAPDIIFVTFSLTNLAPEITTLFAAMSRSDIQAAIERVAGEVQKWVGAALDNTDATLLVGNFEREARPQAGIADGKCPVSEAEFYADVNDAIRDMARSNARVFVVDVDLAAGRVGYKNVCDPRLYYIARMRWANAMVQEVAEEVSRFIFAIETGGRKCLVVDLDNTLWAGVIGEDGVNGIRIATGDHVGEAFLDFQRKIKTLSARGILLAICSKNNEADVEEVFAANDHMPLGLNDFSARRVNWNPKHENLVEIAKELNIGIDSMVFMDDSDFEIGLVRDTLPQLKAIRLPSDSSRLCGVLDDILDFEKPSLTAEDRKKATQYTENRARSDQKRKIGSLDEYLLQLQTVLTVGVNDKQHLDRIHQLSVKTNQFNLTTIRYSVPQIESMLGDPDWTVFTAQANDKHGDLGVIAAGFVRVEGVDGKIDNIAISCRALGRRIETAFMNCIKEHYFQRQKVQRMVGTFVPSAKNVIAGQYYIEQGFLRHGEATGDIEVFSLGREALAFGEATGIKIQWRQGSDGKQVS